MHEYTNSSNANYNVLFKKYDDMDGSLMEDE